MFLNVYHFKSTFFYTRFIVNGTHYGSKIENLVFRLNLPKKHISSPKQDKQTLPQNLTYLD